MFERLTEGSRKVMSLAQQEARRFDHNYVGTEHLLLGLLLEDGNVAAKSLGHFDITLERVCDRVESTVGYGEERSSGGHAPLSPRSEKVMRGARSEALRFRSNYIDPEHILLALLSEDEGTAHSILRDLGGDPDKLREETIRVGGLQRAPIQPPSPDRVVSPSPSWPSTKSPLTRSLRLRNAHLSIEISGDHRRANLDEAMYALQSPPLIWLMDMSKTYRRGVADGEESLCKVVLINTRMSALEILRYIQGIEATFRRAEGEDNRTVKRASIYLLLYEHAAIDQQDLSVPHPSVLLPQNLKGLSDIDPNLKVPEVSVEALM